MRAAGSYIKAVGTASSPVRTRAYDIGLEPVYFGEDMRASRRPENCTISTPSEVDAFVDTFAFGPSSPSTNSGSFSSLATHFPRGNMFDSKENYADSKDYGAFHSDGGMHGWDGNHNSFTTANSAFDDARWREGSFKSHGNGFDGYPQYVLFVLVLSC